MHASFDLRELRSRRFPPLISEQENARAIIHAIHARLAPPHPTGAWISGESFGVPGTLLLRFRNAFRKSGIQKERKKTGQNKGKWATREGGGLLLNGQELSPRHKLRGPELSPRHNLRVRGTSVGPPGHIFGPMRCTSSLERFKW